MERLAVRRTLDLDCSADALWRLVSDPDELASWLGGDVALDLHAGGWGRVVDDDGTARRLVVHDVVERERLAFAWWPEEDDQAVSEVVFVVEATDRGSRLLITETAAGAARATAATSWDVRILSLWLAVCSHAVTV
ncbi:MAG TPA: SRPBCC domain-containing protein [Acidimicrobiales bacterium]